MKYGLFILLVLSIIACRSPQSPVTEDEIDDRGYFSIAQFAADQFETFSGQPYTLLKTVTLNGQTDSSFVSALNMEWGSILAVFFKTDISDQRFIGRYQFSSFEDGVTSSHTFFYEAKDKSLFTRSLQIMVDPFSNKIKSIYIETASKGKTGKLLYIPLKLIQIQEYASSFIGGEKDLRIEYRFL